MLGHVAVQCTTKRSIVLSEARQSERSKDNTCHLGDGAEDFGPKVTTAGASTLFEALFVDNRPSVLLGLWLATVILDSKAMIHTIIFFHLALIVVKF